MEISKEPAISLAGKQKQDFFSLEEAQSSDTGYVVFEGHNGGLVYLVVPASHIKCSEDILINLLFDLAHILSSINLDAQKPLPQIPIGREGFNEPGNDCDILYLKVSLGEHISGDIENYGVATDDLYLHKLLLKNSELEKEIRAVLSNKQQRITEL